MNTKYKITASVCLVLVLAISIAYFTYKDAYAHPILNSGWQSQFESDGDVLNSADPFYLIAQGDSTHHNISDVFGGFSLQTPDCGHAKFGPHITQEWDDVLGKYSFVFHIHIEEDDDQCIRFDRQRTEIKADKQSPETFKGFRGDTVAYRWLFKLDEGFQTSRSFTHIHQIKPFPSNGLGPTITITPVGGRKILANDLEKYNSEMLSMVDSEMEHFVNVTKRLGTPDVLEIRHSDSSRERKVLASAPLNLFRGVWVEASERLTYGHNGKYKIELRDFASGDLLLRYKDLDIDLWPDGIQFHRPKWGIYRGLNTKELLRDEQVSFDQICLIKNRKICR
jgi:hypothetical protein